MEVFHPSPIPPPPLQSGAMHAFFRPRQKRKYINAFPRKREGIDRGSLFLRISREIYACCHLNCRAPKKSALLISYQWINFLILVIFLELQVSFIIRLTALKALYRVDICVGVWTYFETFPSPRESRFHRYNFLKNFSVKFLAKKRAILTHRSIVFSHNFGCCYHRMHAKKSSSINEFKESRFAKSLRKDFCKDAQGGAPPPPPPQPPTRGGEESKVK
jgi:hypothetical protein